MPVDKPMRPEQSSVALDEVEVGDNLTVKYQASDGEQGTFNSSVTRVTTVGGGTEVTFKNDGKIYGDYYPPIVRTPQGLELRLHSLNPTQD